MFMISQQQPAAQSPITVEPFSFSFFMFVTVSVGNNKTAMGGVFRKESFFGLLKYCSILLDAYFYGTLDSSSFMIC